MKQELIHETFSGNPQLLTKTLSNTGHKLASTCDSGGIFAQVGFRNIESVKKHCKTVRATHSRKHLMVNCADIALDASTVSKDGPHDPALYAKTIQNNLIGTFHCVTLAVGGMYQLGDLIDYGADDVIVNTATNSTLDGEMGQKAYSSSEPGVVGMTLPMARDLARTGIRVMTIALSLFMTPMMEGFSHLCVLLSAVKHRFRKNWMNMLNMRSWYSYTENTVLSS